MMTNTRMIPMPNTAIIREEFLNEESSGIFHREIRKFKPAFRHHRKRLARIVVDHWLHKSKMKLLVLRLQKISEKYNKTLCFKALRKSVMINREKLEKNKIAAKFRLRSSIEKVFHAWITHHRIVRSRQSVINKLCWMVRRRRYTDAIWIWRKRVQDCIQMHRKLLVAYQFQTLSLLSTCLVNWHLGLQLCKRKQNLQKLALGYWAHRRLSVAWQGFVKSLAIRHAILKLSEKRRQLLTTLLFQSWRLATVSTVTRLGELQKHACNKLLKRSFLILRHHVPWKRIHEEKKEKALHFYHGQSMHCAYKAWHDYVSIRHIKATLAAAAQTHLRKRLLSFYYNFWCRHIQLKRKEDGAIVAYKKKVSSRCMHIWRDHTQIQTLTSNSSLKYSQDLCKLPYLFKLLKLQKRLLGRFAFVTKVRQRRAPRMRLVNRVISYQVHLLCKKLFGEIKEALQRDSKNAKNENRIIVSNDNSEQVNNNISVGGDAGNKGNVKQMLQRYRLEAASCSMAENGAVGLHALNKESRVTEMVSANKMSSVVGNPIILSSKASKAIRAQPRRPTYLTESLNLDALRKTRLSDNFFMNHDASLLPSYGVKTGGNNEIISKFLGTKSSYSCNILKDSLKVSGEEKCLEPAVSSCNTSNIVSECLSDPKLVRELLWTEDLLCNFRELEEKLSVKGAVLSALKNRHGSVMDEKVKGEQMRYLKQKILGLQDKHSVLVPTIQELHMNFHKKRNSNTAS